VLLPRPSIVDRLEEARLDWACYLARVPDQHGYNAVAFYPERASDPRANRTFTDFRADAAAGRLPAVSWVVPQDPLTEHPPTPPQWGQRFAALAVSAVASGPQWRQAALILNYDESGGFYDHVTPVQVDSSGYGFRVPCTVVSPYARPSHVSHATYDHASVLALLERNFGLAPLAARDAAANPLEECFDFRRPVLDPVVFPDQRRLPNCGVLPGWAADLLAQPLPAAVAPTSSSGSQRWGELALGLGGLGVALLGGATIGFRARDRDGRQ
jgi:phospholipase C